VPSGFRFFFNAIADVVIHCFRHGARPLVASVPSARYYTDFREINGIFVQFKLAAQRIPLAIASVNVQRPTGEALDQEKSVIFFETFKKSR
jgi:hypothetical protein